jgi:hypothetical protein
MGLRGWGSAKVVIPKGLAWRAAEVMEAKEIEEVKEVKERNVGVGEGCCGII